MKLCINCQHYIPPPEPMASSPAASDYAKCRRAIERTSPVNGAVFYRYCDLERGVGFGPHCGPDAINWEERK